MLIHLRLKRLAIETLESRHLLAVWAPQGPAPILEGQVENVAPNNDVAGAVHALAAHPTDADILYAGAVNGGVWKTTNATSPNPIWTPLTDDLASLSIGALEFDPTDPSGETLVAGIGRFSALRREGGPLTGIIRTTDGGNTWAQLGQTDLADVNISGLASRGDTILVAGNDFFGAGREGMYRSSDSGVSFQLISGINGLASGPVTDLVGDPGNPSRLYAAVIPTYDPFSGAMLSSGGIFRTDDLGGTWTDVSGAAGASINAPAVADPEQPCFLSTKLSGVDNIELAVHSNANGGTNAVYVAVVFQGQASGFFRSDEGVDGTDNDGDGQTDEPDETNFVGMDTPETNEGGTLVGLQPRSKPGAQGAIHFSIVADPTNPNVVYAGGDSQPLGAGLDGRFDTDDDDFPNTIGAKDFTGRLFRGDASQAAGSQWVHLTHSNVMGAVGGGTATGSAPHADSREMVFDANGELIEADDGGVYRRTSPRNNSGDWFSMNGSLQVTEFHSIAYDNNANIIIGGAQDTGTTQQTSDGSLAWESVNLRPDFPFRSLGDGGDVAVDETSMPGFSIRYSSFPSLGLFRRQVFNADNNRVSQTFPPGNGLPFLDFECDLQFTTPVELNGVDPTNLVFGGNGGIIESFDQGDNLTIVNAGALGVTANTMVYGGYRAGVPNPAVLYAGGALFDAFGAFVSASNVFVRTTAAEPLALTAAPFPGGAVRDIVLDPDDWMSAFVIDDDNQIFQTTDAGGSWLDITGNLPSLGADNFRSLQYIPGPVVDGVVLGTGSGVFATLSDDLGTWINFGTTIPNAPVYDLDYDATDDVLVAGTLGRGAWLAANASRVLTDEPPIAVDDEYETDEDVRLTISLARGVLANDTDPDGDPLLSNLVSAPENGSLTPAADGSFVYRPNLDFNGVDTFTYVANDDILDSDVATVTITVRAVNDPPAASGDIAATPSVSRRTSPRLPFASARPSRCLDMPSLISTTI